MTKPFARLTSILMQNVLCQQGVWLHQKPASFILLLPKIVTYWQHNAYKPSREGNKNYYMWLFALRVKLKVSLIHCYLHKRIVTIKGTGKNLTLCFPRMKQCITGGIQFRFWGVLGHNVWSRTIHVIHSHQQMREMTETEYTCSARMSSLTGHNDRWTRTVPARGYYTSNYLRSCKQGWQFEWDRPQLRNSTTDGSLIVERITHVM